MKSSFTQTNMPNSWLSALFLCQIKEDWAKIDNQVSAKELNSLRQILTSTFKHFKKELKYVIRVSDFVQLDLGCKAAV